MSQINLLKTFYQSPVFWVYFILVLIVYVLGKFISTDYFNIITKPNFTPPKLLFPIVWTIIFILIIFGGYLTDQSLSGSNQLWFRIIFIIQLILNISWSYIFFNLHNIKLAIYISILLIISILVLLWFSYIALPKGFKLSFWLFIPYLLWCIFALYLTISIYKLNKGEVE